MHGQQCQVRGQRSKNGFYDKKIRMACIIKQLLDSVFVISGIIKVSVSVISLSLRLRLITLTSTLIIPNITKTSSNNCLQSQFGFRLKRSTSTALIAFTDQVLESMDKGCVTGTVFLDFRNALDTVDHLLLIKLKSLGVAGKSLEWFRLYLSGGVLLECVNALSPPAKLTVGVPQGSILGPLLF